MTYQETLYKSAELKAIAGRMLRRIEALNTDGVCVDTILSRGSSGCSLAAGILALSKAPLYHVFVRKEGERSHGSRTHAGSWGKGDAVIVDDFVLTGATVDAIIFSEACVRPKGEKVRAILVAKNNSDTVHGEYNGLPIYHCGIDNCYGE